METKVINILKINDDEIEKIVYRYMEINVQKVINEIVNKGSHLIQDLKKLISKRWVFMENKQVFYDNEVVALYPDLKHYRCQNISESSVSEFDKKFLTFSGFKGSFMSLDENEKSFNRSISFPFKIEPYYVPCEQGERSYRVGYLKDVFTLAGRDMDDDSFQSDPGVIIPIFRLNGLNSDKVSTQKVIKLWLEYGLVPKDLSSDMKDVYKQLLNLYEQRYTDDSFIPDKERLLSSVQSGWFTDTVFNIALDKNKLLAGVKSQTIKIDKTSLFDNLLHGDKYRADIESYDEKMLTDPNRGHWELWEQEETNSTSIQLSEELIARNPRADIKEGGIVGIDFGTKSTVVVHQENSEHTLPMRVGVGHFSKKIEAKHYENPTVMEFINLESFLEQYAAKQGRPNTSWEDITVSHTAFNSLMESSSEHYYSILSDLKQWAGDKKRQIRLKDKRGYDLILPSFLDLNEDDVNPIELYAYYLGLYINNQHNGIYLDYTLSFPVTYEREVREKILQSFELGLKQSLPYSLLKDEEIMKQFRVSSGASEPAAYAICALQEYGFEPEDDEKIFYGVFDFGGGTTDFDFGIWREANRTERRYDFVIEHFAAGGDKYLGGENLLELLTFEVFKANQNTLREGKISFVLPPECQRFAGSEVLLSDSQEAKLNMKQVMEKIRPLWEKHEGYEKEFDKGMIKVNLFDREGQSKPNFELNLNREGLEEMIAQRIEKGIRNFFDSLRRSVNQSKTRNVEKVHILLAGNSSKSPIVKELFQQYIVEETEKIVGENAVGASYFEVLPPLGTEEAYALQEEMGIAVQSDAITRPTGKTGVAFGLVQSRKGGKIKVIDHNVVEDEVKFKYFIGMSKRGKFRTLVDREDEYGKWHLFIDAVEEDFELYYTSLPEASTNQLDIREVQRKKCRIDTTNDDAFVFIRTISPTVIEYVIATEDGIENEQYLHEVKQLQLS